jgi:D-serine dehydratase
LILFVFFKVNVEFIVTKDVKRYSERVGRFAAHLAKVEARNRDGMVDDNLVVIPTLMTAHGAIKILEVGSIIF